MEYTFSMQNILLDWKLLVYLRSVLPLERKDELPPFPAIHVTQHPTQYDLFPGIAERRFTYCFIGLVFILIMVGIVFSPL